MWLEAVIGASNARDRMEEIAEREDSGHVLSIAAPISVSFAKRFGTRTAKTAYAARLPTTALFMCCLLRKAARSLRRFHHPAAARASLHLLPQANIG